MDNLIQELVNQTKSRAIVHLTLEDVHRYPKNWFRISGKEVVVERQLKNGLYLVHFDGKMYKLPKRNLQFIK